MLKSLALVLLVTAAACKTDNAPAQGAAGGASPDPAASGGSKPRSAKIEVPQRRPSLPGPQGAAPTGSGAGGDAGGPNVRRERTMTIDTDGDGVISDEERAAAQQRREASMIARFDHDGDGKVSEEERAAAHRMRAGAIRNRLDANGDGKVTADELAAGGRFRGLAMNQADTDGDGDLSAEELDAALRDRRTERVRSRLAGSAEEPAP